MIIVRQIVLILATLAGLFASSAAPADSLSDQSKAPYLGFTPWPYDMTVEAVEKTNEFIVNNSSIISHHLDNGVPWEEALFEEEYPEHLQKDWGGRIKTTPESHKIFLSVTPINFARSGLSPNWSNKGDNQPLPKAWQERGFDAPEVKQAFLNYARAAVTAFNPDYLAIGIESNLIITNAPDKWQAYLALNKHVYSHLKQEFPDLKIFSTVQYEHLRGIEDEAKKNKHLQVPAVRELMKHSDLLALSTYRYGELHPNPHTDNYFDVALQFGKPMAIAEMGAISQTTQVFGMQLISSQETQYKFLDMVLNSAQEHKFVFVINWVAIDFDYMIEKLPRDSRSIAMAWVHTGLLDKYLKPKMAYQIWQTNLAKHDVDG